MATIETVVTSTSRASGLSPSNQSGERPKKPGWTISIDGHLRRREVIAALAGCSPCEIHGRWRGPVKAIATTGGCEVRCEFFLGQLVNQADIDEERNHDFAELMSELRELSSDYLQLQQLTPATVSSASSEVIEPAAAGEPVEGNDPQAESTLTEVERHPWSDWSPPPRELLVRQLAELGYEVAVDEQGDLRTSLKRRGCDLAVRAQVQPGCLRFSMPIGQWSHVDPAAAQAMLALVEEANQRTRLARLAWTRDGNTIRVQAQVDLTGLPADLDRPACAVLWKHTLAMTMSGLELLLRRLGLELQILADKAHTQLIEDFGPFIQSAVCRA